MEEAKKVCGFYAAELIEPGMTIGIGSGSTVFWFIRELGKRIKSGLVVRAVVTSSNTEQLARQAGVDLIDLSAVDRIPLTIDGADEIDPRGQLIKGGGGALLREKIVAAASEELVIIADNSKLVQQLGKFPLPIEVIPFGYKQVQQNILSSLVCKKITLRKKNGEIFITDEGHYILDCEFEKIEDTEAMNRMMHLIPGVVETGLFINMATKAIIGFDSGKVEVLKYVNH